MAKYIIDVPNQDYSYDKVLHTLKLKFYDDNLSCEIFFDAEPYTQLDREVIENEVWEFVRIITDMTECERKECFGGSTCDLDEYMTYQEAKSKYEAWVKQKDEIHVGDEVTLYDNVKLVVVTIDGTSAQGIDENGECYESIFLNELTKTGRHFDEVEELLKKMREE